MPSRDQPEARDKAQSRDLPLHEARAGQEHTATHDPRRTQTDSDAERPAHLNRDRHLRVAVARPGRAGGTQTCPGCEGNGDLEFGNVPLN